MRPGLTGWYAPRRLQGAGGGPAPAAERHPLELPMGGPVSVDRDPLSWRSRRHVVGIMGLLVDADGPVSERVLLDLFLPKTSSATTDRTLRDLVAYGAVRARRNGHAKQYEPTMLGRAWWDRRVAEWPWPDHDPADVDDDAMEPSG